MPWRARDKLLGNGILTHCEHLNKPKEIITHGIFSGCS